MVTKLEVQRLPLRHREVLTWIKRYEAGTPLVPCAAYQPLDMQTSPREWAARLAPNPDD